MSVKQVIRHSNQRTTEADTEFIVSDPHVVYLDAVLNSPWNEKGGKPPGRDDWSTYRFASRDVIVGVATHRFNRQNRRLEIRAYFTGEHPIFKAMEPTRVMMIMLSSQAYQAGGTMDLFFEQGIPYDVRYLIEDCLGDRIPGHDTLLKADLVKRLYAALSEFPEEMQAAMAEDDVPVELVCFNTYRGNWSPGLIKSLIERGIRLSWIFKNRPDVVQTPLTYVHLSNHLRSALLEDYALYRLADRKMGVSMGKRIESKRDAGDMQYWCVHRLVVPDPQEPSQIDTDSFVDIEPGQRFCLIPVLAHSTASLFDRRKHDFARALKHIHQCKPVLVVPLDFIYLNEIDRKSYITEAKQHGLFVIVIGLTMSQLLAESEYSLSVTAAQVDESDMEEKNANRYTD